MPRSAIDHVDVDRIVPIRVLGQTLVDLVAEPLSDARASIDRDLPESTRPDADAPRAPLWSPPSAPVGHRDI